MENVKLAQLEGKPYNVYNLCKREINLLRQILRNK